MRYESAKLFSDVVEEIVSELGIECEREFMKPVIGKQIESIFAILLGIKGDYEGIIIFEFSNSLTFRIAEKMLAQAGLEAEYTSEKATEKLEIVKEILKEFASLVSSKAITFLDEKGLRYDITAPIVLFDELGRRVSKFSPGVEIRFMTDVGWFKITMIFETTLRSEELWSESDVENEEGTE